ncbi:MAG: N-6 DNA methylase [Planctomycetia bacterium]|nr:N-6 DNA methylase [Planctomycetia bacterium]
MQLLLPGLRDAPTCEAELIGVALGLGARNVPGWSNEEEKLARDVVADSGDRLLDFRARIEQGKDPLGDAYCRLRPPAQRRTTGATYTPRPIVRAMVDWAAKYASPARVVDPGAGSGRYLLAAGRRFPRASLIGIEIDPLAAILLRANLCAAGLADRADIVVGDFRDHCMPRIDGRTLFIGNPPYGRHHRLEAKWKNWLRARANRFGLAASQLAGLHVHFFIATVEQAAKGDYGAFITAAEWLDVNYGKLVRELFLGELGGNCIDVIEPTAVPFPDAATTAAITYFEIGAKPRSIRVRRIDHVGQLSQRDGKTLPRVRLVTEPRWSRLTRGVRKAPEGYIELGELCRVHRGQVTGLNRVWIAGPDSNGLPESVLFPSVTRARELFQAGDALTDAAVLRRVIDLPVDLDRFEADERKAVDRFLRKARGLGAHLGYVANNRRVWWSVGLRTSAPILATYMARRPPAFVRNLAHARHINIAHGLYPREPMSASVLARLVEHLRCMVRTSDGRTYAGGLTKFEPREMERLLVPRPEVLANGA